MNKDKRTPYETIFKDTLPSHHSNAPQVGGFLHINEKSPFGGWDICPECEIKYPSEESYGTIGDVDQYCSEPCFSEAELNNNHRMMEEATAYMETLK